MEIFKLFGRIMVDSAEAEKSIQKTESKAKKMADGLVSGIKTAAKWGAGVAAAAVGVGAAMVAAAKGTASDLDVIDKGAQRMGISAEKYQELAYAAGLCGVEMSTMEKAAKQLEGTDLNMDDALNQIMSIGDESARTQAAIDLFGESVAYKMEPLLKAGGKGLADMRQEAHDLGLVMSQETVTAGATLGDSFSKVEQVIGVVKNNVTIGLMPAVQKILDWVVSNMPLIQETVSSVINAIIPLVDPVLDFFMTNAPPVFQAIIDAVNALMPVVKKVVKSVSSLFSGLFSLLNGDVEGFTTGVTRFFRGMSVGIRDLLESLFGSEIANAIEPLLDALTSIFTGFISLLTGDFDGFTAGIIGFFTDMGVGILSIVDSIFGTDLTTALWPLLDGITALFTGFISLVTGDFEGFTTGITGFFTNMGAGILGIVESVFGSGISEALTPLLDGITTLFTGFIDLLNGDFQGFVDGIVGYFTGLVTTLTDLGSQIMNGLWSGLQSVWGSISSWISGVVNSITDWFSGIGAKIASFFGFDGGGDTDGSHASGLASVPYDGYRATLHRGETVLNPNDTAKLVELLQKGGGGSDDRPIQLTTQIVLDGRIIGQSVTKYQRRKERTAGA